jgi:hypothetical protein
MLPGWPYPGVSSDGATVSLEVLTCCTLNNLCDYLTLLVIYERLNILKDNLALMAMGHVLL